MAFPTKDYILTTNKEEYPKALEVKGQTKKDPSKLLQLDNWKEEEIPKLLDLRYQKESHLFLTKEELIKLVEWKLEKGKFRPTLRKLVASNDESFVKQVTERGYDIFIDYIEGKEGFLTSVKESLEEFCKLKGVGPATATLILSLFPRVGDKKVAPFFSDESFMYFNDIKIKYTLREYLDIYLPKVEAIGEETGIHDLPIIEKFTWTLFMNGKSESSTPTLKRASEDSTVPRKRRK
ncbi:BA75_02837T0 [Komagataella pastoris]|uniref:BA75_02837T0 n=1 Tax=Komagataella pastoris TaxID=4922 RepID=A0A1B2JBZ9_PICPA|nr:BA75_02837T0 [Komagataella pastoris]